MKNDLPTTARLVDAANEFFAAVAADRGTSLEDLGHSTYLYASPSGDGPDMCISMKCVRFLEVDDEPAPFSSFLKAANNYVP